jgi:hypothetical protein
VNAPKKTAFCPRSVFTDFILFSHWTQFISLNTIYDWHLYWERIRSVREILCFCMQSERKFAYVCPETFYVPSGFQTDVFIRIFHLFLRAVFSTHSLFCVFTLLIFGVEYELWIFLYAFFFSPRYLFLLNSKCLLGHPVVKHPRLVLFPFL